MARQASHAGKTRDPPVWRGTSRYEVVGLLGQGGMGVVYEVLDRERGRLVALKTWLDFDPGALYLFKQEFRTLADIRHRNLVHLYELAADDDGRVFFTMELVRGVDFGHHVRGTPTAERAGPTTRTLRPVPAARDTVRPRAQGAASPALAPSPMPANEDRLRAALRQLVEGVHALHGAGKLHRDIKPSNVLVTPEGRVVVLDFGVATEITGPGAIPGGAGERVGTARYMAPEQASDEPPTPASDWYSVGVMLYEALVGHSPFTGSAIDVLTMKSMMDPVAPSERVSGVPADLDALCVSLLRREPELRPPGHEILRRVGVTRSSVPPPARFPDNPDGATAFVGRAGELAALREAFEDVQAGQSVTLRVGGGSGMGKSTVVRCFLDTLAQSGEAALLTGRAYEAEAIPYKAIDGVIDALSNHLVGLADEGDPLELPTDIGSLTRLFPVLRRVPGAGGSVDPSPLDPLEVRRRAFASLREALASLAKRTPVVIFVDDAQWGDVDSATLLLELLRPPAAPPLLLVMTYRSSEAETSPFLVELRDRWPAKAPVRDLAIGPLAVDDSVQLALSLLGASDEAARRTARAVARESRGSPFLIEELVRSNLGPSSTTGATLAVLTLDQMVSERLEHLSEPARSLIEIVAVGGRPLPVAVVADAAGTSGVANELVALLSARRFARTGVREGHETIEMSHDRIRETLLAHLPASTLRAHHARLAGVLERGGATDAEAVAHHWLGAGDVERGARFAEMAAEQAMAKLAFDQAARLLRLAIEHRPAAAARPLRRRLAEALRFAGRAEESARTYLAAVDGAAAGERVEFQRAAAEQLLAAGRIDEGTEMLHGVLGAVGMRAPRSPALALFWLLVYRFWLLVRGLRFHERRAEEVSPEDHLRVEALFTVAMQFSIVDVILGACMQTRHLLEALRVGDGYQVLRATSLEAGHLAAMARRQTQREVALVARSRDMAERDGRKIAHWYFAGAWGIGLFNRGRFQKAWELLEPAERDMLYGHGGFANTVLFAVYAQFFLGDLRGASERVTRLCALAAERGDLYTPVNLLTSVGVNLSLAADEPERARRDVSEALAKWSQSGFHLQHWQAMTFGSEIDLYTGESAAYERFVAQRPALRRSFLLHAGFVRIMTATIQGRLAIASIRSDSPPALRRARIADARRMIRRLESEYEAWAGALALLLRATVENAAGDGAAAARALTEAIPRLEATGAAGYATFARYRLGQLLRGPEGQDLERSALESMYTQGVVQPERYVRVYLPGVWGESESLKARASP
jgi:serine/threonine protein kinase